MSLSSARIASWAMMLGVVVGCGSSVVVMDEPGRNDDDGDVVEPGEPVVPPSEPEEPNDPEPGSRVDCGDRTPIAADFTVGSFTASYYWEDDGEQNTGNDGTDPDIVPVFHGSETVPLPSINYAWDDFLGIDSHGFFGTWDGTIEVHAANASIDASFDISWANASLHVDGQLVERWANDRKVLPLQLTQGVHTIQVAHHNHWHTTGFNASFTDYDHVELAQSVSAAMPYIDADTKIAYVGGYEAEARNNEINVTLEETEAPVLLVLHSFRAINWKVVATSCITGIVVNAAAPGSTVAGNGSAPIIPVEGYVNEEGAAAANELVGLEPEYATYAYTMTDALIPSLD